jgi:hypothetical protein
MLHVAQDIGSKLGRGKDPMNLRIPVKALRAVVALRVVPVVAVPAEDTPMIQEINLL